MRNSVFYTIQYIFAIKSRLTHLSSCIDSLIDFSLFFSLVYFNFLTYFGVIAINYAMDMSLDNPLTSPSDMSLIASAGVDPPPAKELSHKNCINPLRPGDTYST